MTLLPKVIQKKKNEDYDMTDSQKFNNCATLLTNSIFSRYAGKIRESACYDDWLVTLVRGLKSSGICKASQCLYVQRTLFESGDG